MGTEDVYHSKWFAFRVMQFLNSKFRPRKTKNAETVSILIYFLNIYILVNNYYKHTKLSWYNTVGIPFLCIIILPR
nr:unnamed protein product [Callosobruchus chinensis]